MAKAKYETHIKPYLDVIAQMKRDGCTDEEIWTRFDISRNAFYEYKQKYDDFNECLKWSKEIALDTVKNSLFMKCNGYQRLVQRPMKVVEEYINQGVKCKREKVITVDTYEEVPKDTNAIKFFLMNRDSKNWTEKKVIDVSEEFKDNLGVVMLSDLKAPLTPPEETEEEENNE